MTTAKVVGYLICENNSAGHPVVKSRSPKRDFRVRETESNPYCNRYVIREITTEDGFIYERDGEPYEAPLGR